MGEIADAMLQGDLCEMCGVHLPGSGSGFPRYCSHQCATDRGVNKPARDSDGMFYDNGGITPAVDITGLKRGPAVDMMLNAGFSNRQMADELGIKMSTLRAWRSRNKKK